jgi:hypothetical protein
MRQVARPDLDRLQCIACRYLSDSIDGSTSSSHTTPILSNILSFRINLHAVHGLSNPDKLPMLKNYEWLILCQPRIRSPNFDFKLG